MISKAKQVLQLQYASEQLQTIHAPASECPLSAQKLWRILDQKLVNGSCCIG
jgi:hypothetical protein